MTVNQVLMVTLKTAKTYYNCNGTVFATNKKMVGKQLIFSTTLFYIWETVVNDVFLVCLSVFDVLIHSNSLKSDHLQWMGGCLLTITNRYTMQKSIFLFFFEEQETITTITDGQMYRYKNIEASFRFSFISLLFDHLAPICNGMYCGTIDKSKVQYFSNRAHPKMYPFLDYTITDKCIVTTSLYPR